MEDDLGMMEDNLKIMEDNLSSCNLILLHHPEEDSMQKKAYLAIVT
jgi:hypothetical protein